LSSLTNLRILYLSQNQIADLAPLSSLTKLQTLSIGGNPLTNKTCPSKPEFICNFSTDHSF
jgi:internalin A